MKQVLFATAIAAAAAAGTAFAGDVARDTHHDHRHGARVAAATLAPADAPHMTLVEVAHYVSGQLPCEIRRVEAHRGAALYHVAFALANGADAELEVNAHDGSMRWHRLPALPDNDASKEMKR